MPPAAPAQNSQQAMSNLQGFTNGMQSPDQAAAAANNQFQVGAQQQAVQGLRSSLQNTTNLLGQVAPSVMGRTMNSLVTDAQATRQIANEQAPLNDQFNKESTAYGNAQSDYQNALGQAESLANAKLGFQTQQQSYLQGIYSDLAAKEQQSAALAEQHREADLQAQTARQTSGGAGSPVLVGGSNPNVSSGGMSRNNAGGYSFQGSNGQALTMAQYLYQNGTTDPAQIAQTAAKLLAQGTAGDKKASGFITQYIGAHPQLTGTDFANMARAFPQIFGGSF